MKHAKTHTRIRAKAIGIAAASLAAGIGLLILSGMATRSAARSAASAATATQPASAAAPAETQPAGPALPGRVPPANPKAAAGERMGSLLLLFGLMSLALTLIAVGWIVYDIRRSRPAWKTQTKYPVRRRPRKQSP